MIIRDASLDDIQQLVALGEAFHQESMFSRIPFKREKVTQLLESLVKDIQNKKIFFKVCIKEQTVYGGLIGFLSNYFFSDAYAANDLGLFILPDKRGSFAAAKLLKLFQEWGHQTGAMEVCMGVSTGIHAARTGKFYEAMKFQHVGGIYKYAIPQ